MESIFHEKQEGSLCAQHCLNALLQGPYFTAVDLAELASQLDEIERSQLGHDNNSHYSHNMNEEGYFSVQVISKALSIWSLELVPFLQQSSGAQAARDHPENEKAFICNFGNHWFTIRRFGDQWFDLNSILSKPRLISTTYLTIYLAQLQQEGHAIFFITGLLPDCEAEQVISLCPVPDHRSHKTEIHDKSNPSETGGFDEETEIALAVSQAELDQENTSLQRVLESSRLEAQEQELREAMRLSAAEDGHSLEDHVLAEAIELSLNEGLGFVSPSSQSGLPVSQGELRAKRNTFLDRLENK